MFTNTCPICGKTFSIPDAWARKGAGKYCSIECYNSTKSKRIKSVCKICEKEFSYPQSRPTDYCSKKCSNASKQVTKVCPVCNKEFTVARSNADRYNVCSIACKTKNTVYKLCKRCGKTFSDSGRNDRSYCSEICRRPPIIITCLVCGKNFRVVPALEHQKFCSPRCYRRYTGETEPEKNVRLCLENMSIRYIQEHSFPGWRYSVDFFLPDIDVVIEVDSLYWHNKESVRERDARKTAWIKSRGHTVYRIEDTPFYGQLTSDMISFLAKVLGIDNYTVCDVNFISPNPIQTSLFLN